MRAQYALTRRLSGWRHAALLVAVLLAGNASAATMQLIVADDAGEGLNDRTPAEPVGGNSGETLGAQRRIALQYAADILGSRIASRVPIRILATFDPLACTRNSASLGQASPRVFTANFGAGRDNVFYPVALANAERGSRISQTRDDIRATFNSSLDEGSDDCLQGTRWYYGLDDARPAGMARFLSTAVHELTHGLGFVSTVALQDGKDIRAGQFMAITSGSRLPDIFSSFIQDLSFEGQPLWPELSDAQRAESLSDGPDVVWSGANTGSRAASVLDAGLNQGRVMLYAPSPVEAGSSISHWDTSLDPNQIMEPFANARGSVIAGIGLSACVLEDIGWQLINDTRCPDVNTVTIAGDPSSRAERDTPPVSQSSRGSAGSSDGGGGGGCTLDPDARFDPFWLALLVLAAGTLTVRRRRSNR